MIRLAFNRNRGWRLDPAGGGRAAHLLSAPDEPMKIRKLESLLLVSGLTLLAVWAGARLHSTIASRAAVARFQAEQEQASARVLSPSEDPALGARVDFRLWSAQRIQGYEASLAQRTDAPLAVLRISKINLEVPVFEGTDDLTLNRGAGRIQGTARVGQAGNLGIAAHRDGFFRGLKDVGSGDVIELDVPGRKDEYIVRQIRIVNPEDTYVLNPSPTPTLTLVTCFPFYYVGSAPQRFIVQAFLQNPEHTKARNQNSGNRKNPKEETP